jgi:hypothetical protein
VDGQLVEAELAWPALTAYGVRRMAVAVRDGASLSIGSHLDLVDERPPPVGEVGRWIFEPDDAVIRAGLVGPLAGTYPAWLLDPRVAYFSCDTDVWAPTTLAAAFRVRRVLPYDLHTLRAAPGRATVLLARVGNAGRDSTIAVIADPVPTAGIR